MNRFQPWLIAGLLVLLSASPVLSLALFGEPGLGHDWQFHVAHAIAFRKGLAEGVLYPGWAAAMNAGYGAASFCFYPPLPYYLAALGEWITGDIVPGFFLIAALLNVFGGGSLFFLIRRDAGPAGALVGAVLYGRMPYTLLDIYHRFAWAEYVALMGLPFVFLMLRAFVDAPRPRYVVGLALGLAGLAAAHLVTCLTVAPFAAGYLVYESLRRDSLRPLVQPAVLAVLALLVAAAFLGPVLLERHLVHLEHITTSRHGQYGRNFLFQNEVALGYTPSHFKPTVALAAAAQLLVLLGAGAALLLRRRLHGIAIFVLLAGLAHFYMTTALSEPIWRVTPFLGTIQFPWRIVGALGLTAAWLLGIAADRTLTRVGRPRPADLLLGIPVLAVFAVSAVELRTAYAPFLHWMEDQRWFPRKESVTIREYLPSDVTLGNLVDLLEYDPDRRVETTRGDVELHWSEWSPHHRRARVSVGPAGGSVVLPIFRYPGWTVTLNGRPLALKRRNARNLIEFDLPAGDADLAVVFEGTAPRRIGTWLSLAGMALVIAVAFLVRFGRAPPPGTFFTGRRRWGVAAVCGGLLLLPLVFPRPYRRPHVVVITAPGLRADHAHFNGYVRLTTRNIDFLGLMEGVRFRRAYTPVPEPALAAEDIFVTTRLVARLRESGYAIGAVLGENLLAARPRLKAAFPDAVLPRRPRMPAAEVIQRAMVWVRSHERSPFLLWIHLAEPGGPFRPGPERQFVSGPGPRVPPESIPPSMRVTDRFGRVLTDLAVYRDFYDDILFRMDLVVGRFVNDLYRLNLYDRTLLALVGLSGVDLGDGPKALTVGTSLNEVQTAVMLVVKFPGNRHMGHAVVSPPVSTRQLAPTVLGYLEPGPYPTGSLSRVIEKEDRAPEVRVRMPDDSAHERVFDRFKVRWHGDQPPAILKWLPRPPWEEKWQGEPPDPVKALLESERRRRERH